MSLDTAGQRPAFRGEAWAPVNDGQDIFTMSSSLGVRGEGTVGGGGGGLLQPSATEIM